MAQAWSSTHCCDKQARCVDVPVTVDHRFQAGRIGFRDVRPIKRILDARFGNYSRLVQFCIVGASGMVIDLSFYALLAAPAVAYLAGSTPIGPFRFELAPRGCRRRCRSRSHWCGTSHSTAGSLLTMRTGATCSVSFSSMC